MRLVGRHDLQARSAYQPIVHAYGDRRVLFVGHHAGEGLNPLSGATERNGLSILDVTDPAAPQYLAHVPPTGSEANGTQHVQVCDGAALPRADRSRVYAIRTNGQLSYELLDVTDPATPKFLTTIAETGTSARPDSDRGNRETHKFQWDCATGIAYLNGTPQGWRVTRLLQAFDVGDPTAPRHVRDFGLVGYEPSATGPFPEPQVAGLHQPFVVGNRMYLGYNSGDDGVLQIVDRDKFLNGDPQAREPLAPTPENLCVSADLADRLPELLGRPHREADLRRRDRGLRRQPRRAHARPAAGRVGIRDVPLPRAARRAADLRHYRRRAPAADLDVPSSRGARRLLPSRRPLRAALVRRRVSPEFDKTFVVLAYFNGGVRVVDIRNPFVPVEAARFIPEITANTTESCIEIDAARVCDRAIQTNNVNLDDRGLIYALDRASTGLHILELTGEARAIAGL